jgi:hypothetical protein
MLAGIEMLPIYGQGIRRQGHSVNTLLLNVVEEVGVATPLHKLEFDVEQLRFAVVTKRLLGF